MTTWLTETTSEETRGRERIYTIGIKSMAHRENGYLRANDRGLTLRGGMLRASGSVEVALPATLHPARAVMSVASGGAGLSLLPVGAKPVEGKPVLDSLGNWIGQRFNDAWPGADLEYVYGGHYVKPNIYLGNGHPTKFRLRLAGKSGNLTSALDSKRAVSRLTIADAKGKPRLLTRDCYLFDPRDEMAAHVPVKMVLVSESGQEYIDLLLPPGDLSGLVLDPSWESQPGAADGKDTYIDSGTPDTNYGTQNKLDSIMDATGYVRRGLGHFTLSAIPVSATVSLATLTLVCRAALAAGEVRVHALTSSWTEDGATWNSRNGTNNWAVVGGDYSSTVSASANPASWQLNVAYDFTITSLVQAWLTSNVGFLTKLATESDSSKGMAAYSSDHATASQRPKLTVVTVEQASGRPRWWLVHRP